MPKPAHIELTNGEQLPILYEDRSVLAIDKPAHWMLVPFSWQRTNRNLQAAIVSSIASGAFWARSRNIKFLRHVHRLDAETTGILLFARSMGALATYGDLFESRKMEKAYLAVTEGIARQQEWICQLRLAPDPDKIGRMTVDDETGKEAETSFRVLQTKENRTLLEAKPFTGRTHQIRVHLARSGHPVIGDDLYGKALPNANSRQYPMALRAVSLAYSDPFTRRPVKITAPTSSFLREHGFAELSHTLPKPPGR
jgi:RluA family pseudouridine synthase